MAKKTVASNDDQVQPQVTAALDEAMRRAEDVFNSGADADFGLSPVFAGSLTELSDLAHKASAAFTNVITCLAIKSARPHIDIRYHQVQIQDQTKRPAGFNFRGVSERTVYPWLSTRNFEGAKSGWQTRTLERPKPYLKIYDENIGDVKEAFLNCFDEVEEKNENAADALAFILTRQLAKREGKKITLSVPRTRDIDLIVATFKKHIFYKYKGSKGASRLPVLALHAVYSVMISELERFKGLSLRDLEEHSAADSQTGAVGDIEVVDSANGEVFEAVEVKHGIVIDDKIVEDVRQKIMAKDIDRYYVLTTHAQCEPDASLAGKIAGIKDLYECQVIVNGLIPSIRYYLRLLKDPSQVFPAYVKLLGTDKTISHEHREAWNTLAIEK